ncbi:MAG: flotillin, partial [Boseongicola sp. SB0676_bin_33]|nr:flotillin [Boseongicola sp. SB0676_bin_33]
MSGILTTAIVLIVAAVLIVVILARLYRKATRETSLIRTGLGGQRVIMAGGAIALPYFHEVTEVNMRTLRLEVKRSGEDSLITKDRLRVDIGASFSVAVEADAEAVAKAAQTLGDRTFTADKLREIVEGKLVDALRSVAAQMTLDELHEGRSSFVKEVRMLIAEDFAENGLRVQSVSLTALDQTPFAALDENNAFNAVGMRKLAEVIATSKKERAQIDADAEVSVSLSSMEATRRKLEIERDEEQARISQHEEIETLKAGQQAEIARQRADAEREAEAARITKEKSVREAEVARDRAIRAAEIARDLEVQA